MASAEIDTFVDGSLTHTIYTLPSEAANIFLRMLENPERTGQKERKLSETFFLSLAATPCAQHSRAIYILKKSAVPSGYQGSLPPVRGPASEVVEEPGRESGEVSALPGLGPGQKAEHPAHRPPLAG